MTIDPPPGTAEELEPGLVRIRCDNPSPMTHTGTMSYLVGQNEVAVIDPGPLNEAHLDALLAAIGGRPVVAVLVTHAHLDHSPLSHPLADSVGAPILAFGRAEDGRSETMAALAAAGLAGGGEGVDRDFRPDRRLADGEALTVDGDVVRAFHTPGHMANHLAFQWRDSVFSGDLVMGWASTLISPPDGDLSAFLASCDRLKALGAARFYPGHGAPIDDPAARIDWLVAHRHDRTRQILEALPGTPAEIVARVYADTPRELWPAAERNVFAHLVFLVAEGRATARPDLSPTAWFDRS